MKADLHVHTTASDGALSPADVLTQACTAGIDMLAVTDHDTIDGYLAIAATATPGCQLIPGIELSTNWHSTGIHVVGLNIDPDNPTLLTGIRLQQQARLERAERIAQKLTKAGFGQTLAGAMQIAGDSIVGRPHFAQYLVESGQIKDIQTAFRKYLGRGKIGDVRETWAPLQDVIHWITEAGGKAILAHPAKYKLTNMKLNALLGDFTDQGGHGLEVISGRQPQALSSRLARLAQRNGLLASVGSDFHQPSPHHAGLGQHDALPANCEPVWAAW